MNLVLVEVGKNTSYAVERLKLLLKLKKESPSVVSKGPTVKNGIDNIKTNKSGLPFGTIRLK
jgi:hypothetical protein